MSSDTEKALRKLGVEQFVCTEGLVSDPCDETDEAVCRKCVFGKFTYPTGTAALDCIKKKLREKGYRYTIDADKNGAHATIDEYRDGEWWELIDCAPGDTELAALVAAVNAMEVE